MRCGWRGHAAVWMLGAAVGLLTARPAAAYRPFDSTDADVAGHGEFELELGPIGYFTSQAERLLIAPAFVGNLGVWPGWELVLEGRGQAPLDHTVGGARVALGDTAFFAKHVLRDGVLQDKPGLSVAVEFGPLLPGLGADPGVGAQANFIASERWSALTVHLDLAGRLTRAGEPGWFSGVILEGPAAWSARPVAELTFEQARHDGAYLAALLGGQWQVAERVTLDAAVRTAQTAVGQALEVRAGLTWGWQLWAE